MKCLLWIQGDEPFFAACAQQLSNTSMDPTWVLWENSGKKKHQAPAWNQTEAWLMEKRLWKRRPFQIKIKAFLAQNTALPLIFLGEHKNSKGKAPYQKELRGIPLIQFSPAMRWDFGLHFFWNAQDAFPPIWEQAHVVISEKLTWI